MNLGTGGVSLTKVGSLYVGSRGFVPLGPIFFFLASRTILFTASAKAFAEVSFFGLISASSKVFARVFCAALPLDRITGLPDTRVVALLRVVSLRRHLNGSSAISNRINTTSSNLSAFLRVIYILIVWLVVWLGRGRQRQGPV